MGITRKYFQSNLSDFTILNDDATNYVFPAVQTGSFIDSTCEYYNYIPDNTVLMNLVIGSNNELSIDEEVFSEIYLYPNPIDKNSQLLSLNFDDNQSKSIKIYDLMGRLVFDLITNENKIDISSMSSGTYIVKINFNNQTFNSKLIIK